jgi:hypothetical protein
MNNFEKLKSMSIEELADWLDKHGQFDHSPWSDWFAKKYCDNCESIKCRYADAEEKLGFSPFYFYGGEIECAYCELEHKCKFFSELDDTPDNRDTIRMWLESEVKE